ncbi:hypothetical protein [Nitrosomonas sp. Nm58]|uniref:hypothetical protein n=1 Tax=Nitrosomonas sp. Nm58 TaxID=200126 RepID=UPI0015A54A03|nr:hypothetical protein [Nitrosomonas sp. Nm58]
MNNSLFYRDITGMLRLGCRGECRTDGFASYLMFWMYCNMTLVVLSIGNFVNGQYWLSSVGH